MFNRRYQAEALTRLHALFELNQARLLRWLPRTAPLGAMVTCTLATGPVRLILVEQSPYSDVVAVTVAPSGPQWMTPLRLQVRRYHDAGMSEVIDWCGERSVPWRLLARQPQLARDEKMQWNSFLAELLAEVSRHGRATAVARSADLLQ
ncbi:DUF1249 domain-containing protein [Gammaproteobacteria bacterium LSUCC0057]|jgi:uncharacterized protein YqiB (DUF1249 family)|uniref:DUF1249 domain-containing protein n=1 Tax=Gammaproteobacteria bacterium LSUCC0057 TaxID=2559237 RepID=A0A4Y8UJ39_9GAMM|nr:DUF1249 domain-containing protein [Gammaproteobacteria bacterium LSUCC0057]